MAKNSQTNNQQPEPAIEPSFDDKVKAALAGDTPTPATTQTVPQTPTPSDPPPPDTPPPTIPSTTASSEDGSDQTPLSEVTLAGAAAHGREFLHEQIRRQRAAAEAKREAYTPPPATERQISQREAEMAAGRKTVAKHAEQLANRPQVKPDLRKEGFSTPVSRPGEHVPGL
jgi:hypothetical protein